MNNFGKSHKKRPGIAGPLSISLSIWNQSFISIASASVSMEPKQQMMVQSAGV